MGIRFLHAFLTENVLNGFQEVDIKMEIEKYKRDHNGNGPLIVLELAALMDLFCKNKHGVFLGGRYNIDCERIRNVFEQLTLLGATLVFFVDGLYPDNTFYTRLIRADQKYKLNKNKEHIDVMVSGVFFSNLKKLSARYGEVHVAVLNECDIEIAEYATRNKALAIVSNNTDFLIFEGNWKFWSSKDFDCHQLKTKEYNRDALRSELGLRSSQMPILATMSGNDIVPYEFVRGFHRRIKTAHCSKIQMDSCNWKTDWTAFPAIAFEMQSLHFDVNSMSLTDIEYLSKLMFPDGNQNLGVKLIISSLSSYDYSKLCREHGSEILGLLAQSNETMNYKILRNVKNSISLHCSSMSKDDMIPYFQMISPLLRRLMGILLTKANGQLSRTFYCKVKHSENYQQIILESEFPPFEVPPIQVLLLEQIGVNEQLDGIRMELVCWQISSKLTPEIIKNLPLANLINVITLLYLVEIHIDEADCLLLACNCPEEVRDSLILDDMKQFNQRDARISFLFVSLVSYIENCFSCVGLNEFCSQLLLFDGLYFHDLRSNWNSVDKREMLLPIETMRIYIK